MNKISVLLATYNGGKYLSRQLDSLLDQSFQDFKVYIRDDGSDDNTLHIVRQYISDHPDRFELVEDSTQHRGARDSFMFMLEHVPETDYYMFCDQDDVWLAQKIEKSLQALQTLENKIPGKPALVGTDLRVVDENLNTLHESFWNANGVLIDLRQRFAYQHLGGMFAGCTQIFNRAAKRAAFPMHPDAIMHDAWLTLVTSARGRCGNVKEQLILYRQHGDNTIGAGDPGISQYGSNVLKRFYECYYARKTVLDSVGYGGPVKAIFFKTLYLAALALHRLKSILPQK